MLSIQPQASTPIRLSSLNQTTLSCAVASADAHRRHGASAQRDLPYP
jgi:hypothetical protein